MLQFCILSAVPMGRSSTPNGVAWRDDGIWMDEVSDRESSVVSLELPLFVKRTMRNAFAKLATPGFLLSVALVGCGVFSNPAVEAVKKGTPPSRKGI